MPDFSKNFEGRLVTVRARSGGVPLTFANVNAFNTAAVRWDTAFDAAYALDITSSSAQDKLTTGSGAWTVEIYGLDKDWNPVSEIVEMNGTTIVTTTTIFRRVFELVVQTTGADLQNAGDIYVVKTGTGGPYTVPGIPTGLTGAALKAIAGDNFGLSGIWTAPRGTIYTLTALTLTARAQSGTLKLMHGYPTKNKLVYPRRKIDFTPGMPIQFPIAGPVIVVNEKEDIYFLALSAVAGALISVEANFVQQGV